MTIDDVRFELKKVYNRWGIVLKQAKAMEIHPEGDAEIHKGYVTIEYTDGVRNDDRTFWSIFWNKK